MNWIEQIILRRYLANMFNNAFTHWKTTASGFALAILQVCLNGRSTSAFALALATAVVGAIAKDPGSKN